MPVLDLTDTLVDQPAQLAGVCAALDAATLVALDTEFVRTTQYSPRLCLTQLATADGVFCVDELAEMATGPVWDRLCAGPALKIVHAAKQDMEVAWVRHRRLPQPLLDTQIAAALAGHPAQVGYAGLVKALLDVDVDKTHTRADWSKRPLAPELVNYAASDVLHLPEVHALLREELERLGRYAWALEDSARLVDPGLYEVDPGEAWRRLPGLPRLPVPAQFRARRLARWREENAMRADRPRQWILSDRSLIDIAVRRPCTEADLAACVEVAPGTARRQGDALLGELAAADRDAADGALTLTQAERAEVVDPERLKRLGAAVDEIARTLGIAPEILATRKDLTAALRGEDKLRTMSGWRRTVIGEPLLAAVNGL